MNSLTASRGMVTGITLGLTLLLPTITPAAESTLTIASHGQHLAATLNLPDDVEMPPVVLMLHGFTGQRNETPSPVDGTGLYTVMATALAEAGIASLRIDFAGSGESTGAWAETTFTGQIADAVAAFDFLQAHGAVDSSRIGVLGYSQGGLVGAHLAGLRPEVSAVALWAPVTNPLRTYAGILGSDAVETALRAPADQPVSAPMSWGGETTLNAHFFFHELVTVDPVAAIAGYPGPLAIMAGLRETIVTPQPLAAEVLLNYHEGPEALITIDSDHGWGWGWEESKSMVEQHLAPATVDWFTTRLIGASE